MASASIDTPVDAFLSLRARLRTPECTQQFSGRVAQATRPDGSKLQQQLYAEFRKVLLKHAPADPQAKDAKYSNESFTILDQLAHTFAESGSNLHQSIISETESAHSIIQSKITSLSQDASRALNRTSTLYQTVAQPLTELHCLGPDGGQADGVGELLGLAREDLAAAEQCVQGLHEKWKACVAAEHDGWAQLLRGEEEDEGSPEVQRRDLGAAVKEVASAAESEMAAIEAEYAEYIQIESLKVMQTLMEG